MTRLEKIRAKMAETGVDGLLVTSQVNRRYVTGFNSSAGVVLVTANTAYNVVDSRYIEAATAKCFSGIKVLIQGKTFLEDVKSMVKEQGIKKLGFENRAMSVFEFENYKNALDTQLVPFEHGIERVRQIKEPEEIECMKKAQSITEAAFNDILKLIKIGMTEQELATELNYAMNKYGSGGNAFSVIAVSGKNSSLPHGVPSDKKIEDGDFVTMDFGASYNGYASDMTRTVAVGHVTDEMKKVYDTVLKAQLATCDFADVGKTGIEVDGIARKIITDAGYGANFQHGLGHCVGLDVHENPRANQVDTSKFEVGHVLTVEPGIYLPNKFGVRIEDMLYFGPNGKENLSHITKELIIIK